MSKLSCSISDLIFRMLPDGEYTCTDCSNCHIIDNCKNGIYFNHELIQCEFCVKDLRSENGDLIRMYLSYEELGEYKSYVVHSLKYFDIDYKDYHHLCLDCFYTYIRD